MNLAQPLQDDPHPSLPMLLSGMWPSATAVPAASTIVAPMVSASLPSRQPTQTQPDPPLIVAPHEPQPSALLGSWAHGSARAVKPSGKTIGPPEAFGVANG